MWRVYKSVGGASIEMRGALVTALTNDEEFETLVETPLIGGGKRLVGRGLLNRMIMVLDGPRREICLVKS